MFQKDLLCTTLHTNTTNTTNLNCCFHSMGDGDHRCSSLSSQQGVHWWWQSSKNNWTCAVLSTLPWLLPIQVGKHQEKSNQKEFQEVWCLVGCSTSRPRNTFCHRWVHTEVNHPNWWSTPWWPGSTTEAARSDWQHCDFSWRSEKLPMLNKERTLDHLLLVFPSKLTDHWLLGQTRFLNHAWKEWMWKRRLGYLRDCAFNHGQGTANCWAVAAT